MTETLGTSNCPMAGGALGVLIRACPSSDCLRLLKGTDVDPSRMQRSTYERERVTPLGVDNKIYEPSWRNGWGCGGTLRRVEVEGRESATGG